MEILRWIFRLFSGFLVAVGLDYLTSGGGQVMFLNGDLGFWGYLVLAITTVMYATMILPNDN